MELFKGYELGRSRYEIIIYGDEKLLGIFSTDTDFALPVIRREAERAILRLKREGVLNFRTEERDNSEVRGRGNHGFGN